MSEVRKFFEELKNAEGIAYMELPLSEDEFQKADKESKVVTAFLFLLWKKGYPLEKVYKGWFYDLGSGESLEFILRVSDDWVTFLKKVPSEPRCYKVLVDERFWVPKEIDEFAKKLELPL